MSIDDMMGGYWEQEWRFLHVESNGWIRGGHVPTRLHALRSKAKAADRLQSRSALIDLRNETQRLDRELELYANRIQDLKRHVANYTAAVHQALTLADATSFDDDGSIGIAQDEFRRRLERFYGQPDE